MFYDISDICMFGQTLKATPYLRPCLWFLNCFPDEGEETDTLHCIFENLKAVYIFFLQFWTISVKNVSSSMSASLKLFIFITKCKEILLNFIIIIILFINLITH